MTIIQASGAGAGRCDAKCHTARQPKCHCVCGGRYHGKGSKEAREQLTKDYLGDKWREIKADIEARGGRFDDAIQAALGEGIK